MTQGLGPCNAQACGKFMGGAMRIAAIAGALTLALAVPAIADPGGPINEQFYIEGTAGYTIGTDVELAGMDTGTNGGYFIGGAAGYAFAQGISVEGELAFNSRDFEGISASVDATSVMANLIFDFTMEGRNGGYIGGGVGSINVNIDTPGGSVDDWALGYQFMAGFTRQASEDAILFLEYRYQQAEEISSSGVTAEYTGHTVGVGVRFGL